MEFKIDTKDIYTTITPNATELNENLTAAILEKWTELANNGAKNLIIDVINCEKCDATVMDAILHMHEQFYTNEQSLVFTNVKPDVKKELQRHEYYDAINVAPTMVEAVDIVSMELLQRDLLGEEDDTI